MLTRRTNILFNEHDWHMLTTLAKEKSTSFGQLVRHAVKKTYHKKATSLHPLEVAQNLTKHHKVKPFTFKEIKDMINYGREY